VDNQAWAIVCAGVILVVAIICSTAVAVTFIKSHSDRSANPATVEFGFRFLFLNIIISAAIILGVSGKLTEGAIALLSSVAGYILGGVRANVSGRKKGTSKITQAEQGAAADRPRE
jgi:hypothetical protein